MPGVGSELGSKLALPPYVASTSYVPAATPPRLNVADAAPLETPLETGEPIVEPPCLTVKVTVPAPTAADELTLAVRATLPPLVPEALPASVLVDAGLTVRAPVLFVAR